MKPQIAKNDAGRWVLSLGPIALADCKTWHGAVSELLSLRNSGEPTC